MDVARFVAERRPRWARLEQLLQKAEAEPDRALGRHRLRELLGLYRQVCSDLNEARSYTADPEVLSRLNDLAGRGYRFVYRRPQDGALLKAVRAFFDQELPAAFRRRSHAVLASAAAFVAGALLGFLAVMARPADAVRLVPQQFFAESPRERVEKIESSRERVAELEDAASFGAQLYTHNIQVSFLAFSLGALSVLGGAWLIFYNGVVLGAVAAQYVLDGVHVFFLAWVGPHGALELPAIVFGAAAGLVVGRALLLPGQAGTGTALREVLPDAWRMMAGAAAILVLAGIVEGSFSQFTARTFPYPLKIAVAVALFCGLMGYLFVRPLPGGRRP